MKKNDIKTREDVFLLVSSFYIKVRNDDIIKPFFSTIEDWDKHLEKLTTFWESNLFFKTKYYGNPIEAHIKVDKLHDNAITQKHFGHWMNLWFDTIEELFEGEYANMAKNRARKMSAFLYLKLFEGRSR